MTIKESEEFSDKLDDYYLMLEDEVLPMLSKIDSKLEDSLMDREKYDKIYSLIVEIRDLIEEEI